MTSPNHALDSAIALWQAPRRARVMRSMRIPEGLTLLLRILAGERQALVEAQSLTRLDEDAIISIVEFYVLQIMLFRGAPPRRVLGVEPGAERNQIRRHMGYLMSWLHPDREASGWRLVFARRVLDSWRQIEKGPEEDGPQLPAIATSPGRGLFLMPRIAARPQRVGWVRFPLGVWVRFPLGVWRRLKQLGMVAVVLAVVSDDLGREVGQTSFWDFLIGCLVKIAA
jgi:hypothetical protein